MTTASQLQRVFDPVSAPLTHVCHLCVTRRKGLVKTTYNNSTGVLFRGRYVITAAHNVHSTALSKVKSIEVSIGQAMVTGNAAIRVTEWRVASGYDWKDFPRDFAVLKLPQPVTTDHLFQLSPVSSSSDVTDPVDIAGYPGESHGDRNGKNMFLAVGPASFVSGSPLITYDIDTEGGNSGGPVWVAQANGHPRLIGIHVSEYGETRGQARLADIDFVNEVERIIDDLG